MAQYTYLNNVPVARVHKRNAQEVMATEAGIKATISKEFVALIASNKNAFDVEVRQRLVEQVTILLEDYEDACFKEWAAQYIIDNPGDCVDELEQADESPKSKVAETWGKTQ